MVFSIIGSAAERRIHYSRRVRMETRSQLLVDQHPIFLQQLRFSIAETAHGIAPCNLAALYTTI